jgi:predicted amidohydrolase YtcJ
MKRSTILGAWFLAFVTTFSMARAAALPDMADLIIYNAKVLTVNSNFTVASAIAVKGDRILAVGKDRRLEEFRGPETRIVDAQGRTIMPGMYDASVSSFAAAMSEIKKPWPVINSISNAQEYIRKQATNTAKGEWIALNFIPPTRLKEGRLPTKEELDAATTNVPVYWSFGTTTVVNSKALEVSRIDKDTPAPAGGEIVMDPRHHKPTGLLRNAFSLLKLPKPDQPPTAAQERVALKHLYQLFNEQGITSIGEDAAGPAAIDLFRDMSSSNELTVRINCRRYFHPSADADESIDRLALLTNAPAGKPAYGPSGVGDDWVRIGTLETEIDGNAGMGTAYLRTPYGIGPTYMNAELAYRGLLLQNAFALPQVYLAAAQQGWQLETHAAGDAALDFLLNSYEQVQFKLDIRQRRFLIAHPEFQAAQDWIRCQKLGIGAVIEPTCLYEDGAILQKTLGTNRLTYYMPLKGWFDRGIVAGGASAHFLGLDSLNTPKPWNPWLGIWVTLTRETKDGVEINPQEKLTREQAIRLYTYNNAWLNFEENQKGSLEPGKLADFIMVDMDVMKCPVDEILNAKVLFTMVGGKVVWQAIEPIFPGPQVIPSVTVNVPNAPTPVVPAVVNTQSSTAAAKHAAQGTTGINPYAPVIESAPTTVVATDVTTASNAAPAVATTGQSAATTNSTASATNASATATQTSEAKPDSTTSTEAVSGIAGAAPAEVAANQTSAKASTVTTNQAPSAPATNAVPSATTTNAANSIAVPTQVATATTTSSGPDATVAIPAATVSATAQAPSTTTDSSATATTAPTQVAAATAPAPAATTSSTADTSANTTTSTTTSPSTTTTNDAPASGNQDWSRVSPGTK